MREINSAPLAGHGWSRRATRAPASTARSTRLSGPGPCRGHRRGHARPGRRLRSGRINTRVQLAEAGSHLAPPITHRLMDGGVTLQDPATRYVDAGVEVGMDSVILANTHVSGTTVGRDCLLGPNAIIRNSTIDDCSRVTASMLMGPCCNRCWKRGLLAHLRSGTRCAAWSSVGTGSELNRLVLGPGSKMQHFGYLGDATVGSGANLGADDHLQLRRPGHPTGVGEGASWAAGRSSWRRLRWAARP